MSPAASNGTGVSVRGIVAEQLGVCPEELEVSLADDLAATPST